MRTFLTLSLVAALLGCAPSTSLAPKSVSPSATPTLAPKPTPASLGTTQEIWLHDARLLITPTKSVAQIVRRAISPSDERLYVAINFEITSLGPGTWRPRADASVERPTLCLDLKPEADAERPVCGGVNFLPQFQTTAGSAWAACPSGFADELFWNQEPELPLSPLKAGGSRSGWLTWCLETSFGSVNLDEYAESLRLTTLGVFGREAEWEISLTK